MVNWSVLLSGQSSFVTSLCPYTGQAYGRGHICLEGSRWLSGKEINTEAKGDRFESPSGT